MEPSRQTAEHLTDIQAQLIAREPLFHRPEYGTSRQAFEAMIVDDYWEVGASGRRYSRAYVLDTLVQRYAAPCCDNWVTEDFYCQALSPGVYLLTYTLKQGERISRRMTIWQNRTGDWRAIYHQGTLVTDT